MEFMRIGPEAEEFINNFFDKYEDKILAFAKGKQIGIDCLDSKSRSNSN